MIVTGGGIVNLPSVAARLGGPGEFAHYATSKGAIDSFTLGLGREVADEGIRVNAVAPGLIDTEMNPGERLARLVLGVPIRRAGMASEVADAVAWLLSPGASYVTGTTLTVPGGRQGRSVSRPCWQTPGGRGSPASACGSPGWSPA